MNIKELCLEEIELNQYFVDEGVSCLLQTILFIRAPNQNVQPEDHQCQRLNLSYAKCGPSDIDQTVSESLEMLHRFKTPIGPKIQKGIINLTFYEHRVSALFGWIHSKEKVYFERWKIPVVIDERAYPHTPTPSLSSRSSRTSSSEKGHAPSPFIHTSGGGDHDKDNLQQQQEIEAAAIDAIARQHMYSHARNQVQQRILTILEVSVV